MKNKVAFSYSSENVSPGYLLWKVHMLWQRAIKRELDSIDLTHTQFVLLSVLAMLSRSNKVVTQTDIATHSNTDRMMVSKVLRTLEKKLYINRRADIHDTRIKAISFTFHGSKILQQAINRVENVDARFFSILKDEHQVYIECMHALSEQGK